MSIIQELDNNLITTINFDGSTAYDNFWWFYTNGLTWAGLAVAIVFYLVYYAKAEKKQILLIIAAVAFLFLLCDQIPASVIKPIVARFRPSHNPDLEGQLSFVNGYMGGRYGFPSNHACNGFGIAMFLTLLAKNWKVSLTAFLWAAGSCYSRMYLGVHYPTDILVGALLGVCFAYLSFYLFKKVGGSPALYRDKNMQWVPAMFAITIIIILAAEISF